MNLSNEAQAEEAVEAWRAEPIKAQILNIKKALEALELNEMYYEQKGSDRAVARIGRIRKILEKRQEELSAG